jgi:hypothetical protein
MVAQVFRPSYLGDRGWEENNCRPAQAFKTPSQPIKKTGCGGTHISSQLFRKYKQEDCVQPPSSGINVDLILKITQSKRSGVWLKWYSTCLASVTPWVQPQYCQKKIYIQRERERERGRKFICLFLGRLSVQCLYLIYTLSTCLAGLQCIWEGRMKVGSLLYWVWCMNITFILKKTKAWK